MGEETSRVPSQTHRDTLRTSLTWGWPRATEKRLLPTSLALRLIEGLPVPPGH